MNRHDRRKMSKLNGAQQLGNGRSAAPVTVVVNNVAGDGSTIQTKLHNQQALDEAYLRGYQDASTYQYSNQLLWATTEFVELLFNVRKELELVDAFTELPLTAQVRSFIISCRQRAFTAFYDLKQFNQDAFEGGGLPEEIEQLIVERLQALEEFDKAGLNADITRLRQLAREKRLYAGLDRVAAAKRNRGIAPERAYVGKRALELQRLSAYKGKSWAQRAGLEIVAEIERLPEAKRSAEQKSALEWLSVYKGVLRRLGQEISEAKSDYKASIVTT